MAPAEGRELRVGILCDSMVFQHWQAESIRRVLAVPGVVPVVLIQNYRQSTAKRSLLHRGLHHPWGMALYLHYRRRYFKPPAMAPIDMTVELAHVPRLKCRAEHRGHAQYFSAGDVQAIRAFTPDILLRFGFNILRGEILDLPRHGIWSFHHGDETKYRGGPPGFWEIMHGDPVTGAILQRLTERLDGGIVLRKGWFKTIDHSLSETVDTVLNQSAEWPAQVCRQILLGDERVTNGEPSATKAHVYRYPRNAQFLRFLWKQASNKARFHREELKRHEEWNIGVLYQPIHSLLEDRHSLNVRWLPSPSKGAFRADPFGYVTPDGQLNVLYEKYDYAKGVGEINRIRPKRDNILKRSRAMLTAASHLSYPFILERDGVVYVIPESAASGRVELYRVDEANEAFVHVRTLIHEAVFDPTLLEHEGRWWLFGTKAPLTNVALHAWHAPDPFGPFTPHAMNPIKMDIRSARPAGTPFRHNGELYRPAQDSSVTYGHRIALNCVYELTPTRFREGTVKFIGPIKGPYGQGLHTVSAVGDIVLVDGKRWSHSKAQEERVRRRKWKRFRGRSSDEDDGDA